MSIDRPRLLFIAPRLPREGAMHGGGIAVTAYLAMLLERCRVDMICLGVSEDEGAAAKLWPGVEHVEVIAYRSGLKGRVAGAWRDLRRPDLWGRGAWGRLKDAVHRRVTAERYDVVQVEHQETAMWIECESKAAWIMDFHDVISGLDPEGCPAGSPFDMVKSLDEARRQEKEILERYHAVAVRSESDRRRLAVHGSDRIHLLRHPVSFPARVTPRDGRLPGRLLLTGSFRRPHNVAAARTLAGEMLHRIRERHPGAELLIVGDGADESLADLQGIDGVLVQGTVPDLSPFYQEAMVLVNPVYLGGGVISRNLDALAHGLPVVTTSAGAAGLDFVGGFEAVDAVSDTAGAVVRLLEDEPHWKEMSRLARGNMERDYSRAVITGQLETLHRRALEVRGDG